MLHFRLNAVLRSNKIHFFFPRFLYFILLAACLANAGTAAAQSDTLKIDSLFHKKAKRKLFVAPVIGYSPETRLFFGVGGVYYLPPSKKYPETNASVIKLTAEYTLNHQIESNLNGESFFRNNLFKGNYSISYYEFPDYFFGIGNTTIDSNKERFDNDFFNALINVQRRFYPSFYAGIKTFIEHTHIYDIDSGGIFYTQDIPGEAGGWNTGLGLWLTYDTRDNIYFPMKGSYLDVAAVPHESWLGSNYNYMDYTLEYSQFKRIMKDDALGVNFYGKFLPGDPPFNRMAELGGDTHMRGNYEGRFRDKNYLTLQGEYRITFLKYLGITVFGGLGEVADRFSNFSTEGLKYSIGAGGRLFIVPEDKVSIRIDYGFGSDGMQGLYVSFREAF